MHIRQYHAFEQSLNFQRYHFLVDLFSTWIDHGNNFSPPSKKINKKPPHFSCCFNGPFGKEICHIHPIRGWAAFSLWPGCRLAWIDGWIGLESWSFQTVDIFPPLLCGRFLHPPSEHLQARRHLAWRVFFLFVGSFFFWPAKDFSGKDVCSAKLFTHRNFEDAFLNQVMLFFISSINPPWNWR